MRVTRRVWVAAVVWVAFWSLYPTFGRPRAFRAAIQAGARQLETCDPIPEERVRQACWSNAGARMQQSLDAITLHNEYAGYAPVWAGVGVGVPLIGLLALRMPMRRRRA